VDKDKIDAIAKRADIIHKKIVTLLVIDGAIWLYGIKSNDLLLNVLSGLLFLIASFAVISNLLKLGDLEKQLKELIDE